jgi:methylglyoxal synthase
MRNRRDKVNQLKAEANQPLAGEKKIEQKQQFSEIEILSFVLDPLKSYQHRIEHYTGHDDQIIFDEQFLLDDSDDPEKVLQELRKKQQRRIQMEEEEKKLSDNIKLSDKKEVKEVNEESEAFRKIRDYLK